jgi:CDP-paratose 2-epimerase
MSIVVVTGSAGLIGSETVAFFIERGFLVVGIDNNMREFLFGKDASTLWNRERLISDYKDKYIHYSIDLRERHEVEKVFHCYGTDIVLIVHTAGQPSHDWSSKNPYMDFDLNANSTLNLLESTRQYCPEAVFVFCSTNKVYGDTPNDLPLEELDSRWEIVATHPYYQGVDERMSIDGSTHSLFGVSKAAADLLVQEYGRYFGIKGASFRGGCLTGPAHSGTKLHGFLSYLMRCTVTETPYQVYGYKGKQVRDNIHSYDLVNAFYHFYQNPRVGEVYNIGGSRYSNCSMLEAIQICELIAGKRLNWDYSESNRIGDHIWWISDISKFSQHYPNWSLTYDVESILKEIFYENVERWI